MGRLKQFGKALASGLVADALVNSGGRRSVKSPSLVHYPEQFELFGQGKYKVRRNGRRRYRRYSGVSKRRVNAKSSYVSPGDVMKTAAVATYLAVGQLLK